LLSLRSIHRFAGGWTEEPEALHMIRGQLRGKQRVGMAGDDGEKRAREDDQQRGNGQRDETANPDGTRSIRYGRQGPTARLETRGQGLSAKAVGTGPEELPRAAFLSGNRSTGWARVEMPLHIGPLGFR
jgi:hypothetical protein